MSDAPSKPEYRWFATNPDDIIDKERVLDRAGKPYPLQHELEVMLAIIMPEMRRDSTVMMCLHEWIHGTTTLEKATVTLLETLWKQNRYLMEIIEREYLYGLPPIKVEPPVQVESSAEKTYTARKNGVWICSLCENPFVKERPGVFKRACGCLTEREITNSPKGVAISKQSLCAHGQEGFCFKCQEKP